MRVLLITGHDHWGPLDANSPIAQIVMGLAEAGHDVVYISNDKANDPVNAIYGEPIQFPQQRVRTIRFRIPGDGMIWVHMRRIPVIRGLYHRCREIMFVVIACLIALREAHRCSPAIVYGYEVIGAVAAKLVSALLRKPFVSRFQGTIMHPLLSAARRGLLSRLNLARYYLHIWALKCPANLIVMTNDGTRGELVVRTLGNRSPMVFWPNGTDFLEDGGDRDDPQSASQETSMKLGIPLGAPVVVSVSRLVDWKRVDRVMRAMPLVMDKVPDTRYVVVGDGPERSRLQEMADKLGISERVVFAGNLPHSQVRRVMERASVFISMYDLSNVGNPLIEALSLGKPIVTYDVGDTSEVIKDRENGLLLKSDDPETVADAIIRILADRAFSEELSAGARRYAATHFWTWKQRIDAEIALLEKVARGDRVAI